MGRWFTRFATSSKQVYSSNGVRTCSPIAFFSASLQLFTNASAVPFWCGAPGVINFHCMPLSTQYHSRVSSDREKPSKCLDKLHCGTICRDFQMHSSCIQTREDDSVVFSCLVTTNFHSYRSEIITRYIVEWGGGVCGDTRNCGRFAIN